MTATEHISQEEWQWVHDMIRDIEREEQRDQYLSSLFQWGLAVRQFRKVEIKRMILGNPDEADFDYHAMCLHALLAIGTALKMNVGQFEREDLIKFHVEPEHILCYVQELEQSFREWHHGFTPQELGAAKAKIFGATA